MVYPRSGMYYAKLTIIAICSLLLLGSCYELTYDPSLAGDAPWSTGTAWRSQEILLPDPEPLVYPESELSKTMTAADLLDMALYNNPATRVSWHAARAAAFGYRVALAAYYPSVGYSETATASYNVVGGTAGAASFNLSSTPLLNTNSTEQAGIITNPTVSKQLTLFDNLYVNYLLMDFGGRDATAALARQMLYAANWQHNFTMQEVMLSVLNAYTSYIGNKGLVEADIQDLKDAEVALKATVVMRDAGLATFTDVLQAQSAVEQARYNLEQAKGAEKTSLANLMIAVGLPPQTQVSVNGLPDKLPVIDISGNVATLFELAKTKRPDLGIAVAEVKEQIEQLAISYSAGMPTINLTGLSDRLHFFVPSCTKGSRSDSITAELNIPVFSGFYYLNQQREIREQIEEALANVEVQVSNVATQVATNYYAFTTAVAALPSSEALLDSSDRAYRGLLVQYKMGVSSILDVLTSLTVLSNARAQVVVTRTQWAAALANLAFSVGILEDGSPHWENAPPNKLYKLPISYPLPNSYPIPSQGQHP